MMGVYIKGIQMPKENQRGLWVVIHSDGTVEYDTGDYGWKTLRQSAIPVPPHGRLIDADALIDNKEWVRDAWGQDEGITEAVNVANIINAPTIIPAEEAKDTNVPTYDLLYEEGGLDT